MCLNTEAKSYLSVKVYTVKCTCICSQFKFLIVERGHKEEFLVPKIQVIPKKVYVLVSTLHNYIISFCATKENN